MTEVDRALSQLDFIQAQMAASTRFRGLAPHAVTLTGLLAFATAAAQAAWPQLPWSRGTGFIIAWVAAAVASTAIIGIESLGRSRDCTAAWRIS